MPSPVEPSYRALQVAAMPGLGRPEVIAPLLECIRRSMDHLASVPQTSLTSLVPGKEYFAYSETRPKVRSSRGINRELFTPDVDHVVNTIAALLAGDVPDDPLDLHTALYTAAIALPAAIDVTKDGDKKSPGTYLEILVGQLVATMFQTQPTKSVVAPTLDLEISLPTDFVFDLGPNKSRIHLPVKASTRERVIQVWAHQRVLDGMHGVNRFRGLLVVLAETNRQSVNNSITEVCLPKQWTAYQMYIAQLHRVYYFDVPDKYKTLRDNYPFLEVKSFADFFYEYESIARPNLAISDLVDDAAGTADAAQEPVDLNDDWSG